MKSFTLIAIIVLISSDLTGQVNFGFQFELGSNNLLGISNDTIVPHGYSGAVFTQLKLLNYSPSLIVKKKLNNKFSIESGLAYIPVNHDINLKFYHSFFKYHLDKTLTIRLRYISIPLNINYKAPFNDKTALILSGGINTKILINGKDNYQKIILEEIGLPRERYQKLLFSPALAAAYQIKTSSKGMLEAGFFADFDMNSILNRKWLWGFYNNLDTARGIRYGIQVKYIIN